MLTLSEVPIDQKRVVIRVDFNVPISSESVVSDVRIKATLPTINYCVERNAEVFLLSHLGRPKGAIEPNLSLRPVARQLAKLLGRSVEFIDDWQGYFESRVNPSVVVPGRICLLENLRFDPGEEINDKELGTKLGTIGDVYVFDAFATAHRAHASSHEAIKAAPISCAGPLLTQEINRLGAVMEVPKRPLVAVIGGAKVSDKLNMLGRLGTVVDSLLVGGGMANTLLLAQGWSIGRSLVERELVTTAQHIEATVPLVLPVDVMVTDEIGSKAIATHRLLDQVTANDKIVDIGPESARRFAKIIHSANTILWNGPLGVFEIDQFGEGTRVATTAIANSDGYSVVGGGDTLAAITKYSSTASFDYISTGGGAFLEFIEGRKLPAIEALNSR